MITLTSVTSADGDGCQLVGGCQARFEQGVVVHDCGDDGIYVGSDARLLAVGVTIERSGGYGVVAVDSAKVELQGCTVRDNAPGDYGEYSGGEIVRRQQ
jgi:hypothetical protein